MAASAVRLARRIAVVAAVESTIEPTMSLLREEAAGGRRRCRDRLAAVLRRLAAVRGPRSRRLPPLHRHSRRRHRRVVRRRRAGAGDDGTGGGARRRSGPGPILARPGGRCRAGTRPMTLNVLLITLDQFRGDCLSAAGHPLVRTPNLDTLAAAGVRLQRHYSQAAPCGPGRASLYTGMYQMNHRVVGNGTPLDARFDTIALAARRAGYAPVLFGYTDQALDPRLTDGPDDPRLSTYNGILPGFDAVLDIPDDHGPWVEWLAELGHDTAPGCDGPARRPKSDRPAEHSVSAFLTDHAIEWMRRQEAPWFAHLSYLRPHPPYAAAGHWSAEYDPADVTLPIAPAEHRHRLHDMVLADARTAAPADEAGLRHHAGAVLRDDQRGRRPVRPGLGDAARPRRVGRHDGDRHVRSRRDARRSRSASRRSDTGSRATTSSESSGTRTRSTPTAAPSMRSPRTST